MSLDGFIAGPDGALDWLDGPETIDGEDYGYGEFMADVDALVMGRRTFETVLGFDGDWPYDKPILVLSGSMTEVPDKARDVEIIAGTPAEIVAAAEARGHGSLYIDGGAVVSSFIDAGLLDDLIVSVLPVALGAGIGLFTSIAEHAWFELVDSRTFANGMVQLHYRPRS